MNWIKSLKKRKYLNEINQVDLVSYLTISPTCKKSAAVDFEKIIAR